MAVSLFTVLPIELYKFCISLQLTLTKDMASLIGGKSIGVSAEQSLTAISSLKVGTGLLIFLLIMMGYSIIKVFFANLMSTIYAAQSAVTITRTIAGAMK